MMVSIGSVGVGELVSIQSQRKMKYPRCRHEIKFTIFSQSEDSFVCFGAKPTEKASALHFLQDRKKTRKGKAP